MILVVDDNGDLRGLVIEILSATGHDVVGCENGCDALRYLRAAPRPCLILFDLEMPTMNGYELRAAQLADERLASIPVAVITSERNIDRTRLGAIPVLRKPFTSTQLLATVAQLVA